MELPADYDVSYTLRVRDLIRQLVVRAKQIGLGIQVVSALKELDRRLRVYPQFGDPLRDMPNLGGQLWIGVVPPLVVRYLLDEEKRTVSIGSPILVLPGLRL